VYGAVPPDGYTEKLVEPIPGVLEMQFITFDVGNTVAANGPDEADPFWNVAYRA
jgi:hypothetical protein